MNDQSAKEKILDRPYITALIFTFLFLILHVFCNFITWRANLWGVFHLSFFKSWQQLLFISAALFFISTGYILDRTGVKFPVGGKSLLPLVIFGILVALSFYFLRIGPFILGDAVWLIAKLEQGFVKFVEAGDMLIHRLLFILLPAGRIAAIDTYVWTSIVSGIVFLAILLGWVRKAGKSLGNTWLIFLSFISSASLLLFYGYAESYTLLYVGTFVFLIFSLNALETGKWLTPCLFLLLSIFLHISAICFIPGFIFLLVLMRNGSIPANAKRSFKISVAAMLIFIIIISIFYTKSQYPIFLSLFPHDGITYTLFSFPHIRDTFNEFLLVVPFGLILLIISLKKEIASRQMLLMAAFSVFNVIGTFIVDPAFEAADWDLMSLQCLPVLMLGLLSAQQAGIFTRPWRYIGIVLAIIMFHSLPWIISNNSLEMAVNQYVEIANAYKHKDPAHLFFKGSWNLLTIAKSSEYYKKAVYVCRYALDRNINSPSLFQNCGLAYARLEQYYEASIYFNKAAEGYPEGSLQKAEAHVNLAVSLLQLGKYKEANEAAKKALVLKAQINQTVKQTEVWFWDIIIDYQITNEPQIAMDCSWLLMHLAPQYPNSYINYGLALAKNGRTNDAVVAWQEGLMKFPKNTRLRELIYESTAPLKNRN